MLTYASSAILLRSYNQHCGVGIVRWTPNRPGLRHRAARLLCSTAHATVVCAGGYAQSCIEVYDDVIMSR